ncbi:MAG TPA: hypothetical protein PLJ89_07945, partial [Thermoleophilia bacterium]|nr:hypothetical protein [Thermoleophilia bacterium]
MGRGAAARARDARHRRPVEGGDIGRRELVGDRHDRLPGRRRPAGPAALGRAVVLARSAARLAEAAQDLRAHVAHVRGPGPLIGVLERVPGGGGAVHRRRPGTRRREAAG